MRDYRPNYTEYGISVERLKELRAYCYQYPEWLAEANSLVGVGAQKYSDMPHGTDVGDPVGRAVERRAVLLNKAATVQRVARTVGEGRWYTALIQHCCIGKSWDDIEKALMPTSNRNEFYKIRRMFYLLLHVTLDEEAQQFD